MKKLLSILILLLTSTCLWSAPLLDAGAVTATHGLPITITGSGFGSTGPTIYKWDNFEGATHTVGQTIGAGPQAVAWVTTWDSNLPKIASSANRTGSTKYVSQPYALSWGGGFAYVYPSTPSPVYVTYYTRWNGYQEGTNVKHITIVNQSGAGQYWSWNYGVNIVQHYQDGVTQATIYKGDSILSDYGSVAGVPTTNDWVRGEFYGVESTVDTGDGTGIWLEQQSTDGAFATILNNTALNTRATNVHWANSAFGLYGSYTHGEVDFDDIYIANSRARVEIGNNAVFANCTHREIQIPTAWAGGSITVTVNAGSFTAGSAYLFVIDSSGVASSGKEITVGGSTPTAIKLYLTNTSSQGAAQSNPNASLGGYRSTTQLSSTSMKNLFDDVTVAEAVVGDVEYRMIDVYNAGSVDMKKVQIFMKTPTSSTSTELAFGYSATAQPHADSWNGEALATESAAPASPAFSFANRTRGSPLSLGTIPAGQSVRVGIRRTVNALSSWTTSDLGVIGTRWLGE